MSEIEKINRERMMIARDLALIREGHLLRIVRNKRLPIAQRYAACMIHSPDLYDDSIELSDESLMSEINQFLSENS